MKSFFQTSREGGVDLDPTLSDSPQRNDRSALPLEQIEKSRWERTWPALACGAGLFSDGYLNSFVLSRFVPSAACKLMLTRSQSHRTGQHHTDHNLRRPVP